MLTLENQSTNEVTIVGKLLDCQVTTGTNTSGAPFARANLTVRVSQDYDGRTEISEIPVSAYANQFKRDGSVSKAYESIVSLAKMKTAINSGIDNADSVSIGLASVEENYYVARNSGTLVDNWQIRAPFIGENRRSKDTATFSINAFILDMKDELNRDGDPTGRMVIKGGVVKYGNKLDVIEFIVENPDNVAFVERAWSVNDTVNIGGRIRATVKEQEVTKPVSSWGEVISSTVSRPVYELIVTCGSEEPLPEEMAYDSKEIKKGFAVRKSNIDQKMAEAKMGARPVAKKANDDWMDM